MRGLWQARVDYSWRFHFKARRTAISSGLRQSCEFQAVQFFLYCYPIYPLSHFLETLYSSPCY
jgi:hypothetical protein